MDTIIVVNVGMKFVDEGSWHWLDYVCGLSWVGGTSVPTCPGMFWDGVKYPRMGLGTGSRW